MSIVPKNIRRLLVVFLFVCPAVFAADVFDSATGQRMSSAVLLERIAKADVVVVGERHTDAAGHIWQQQLLKQLFAADGSTFLSVEEFDRSQQLYLDAYAAGEMTGAELKQQRNFVGPGVKDHWEEWYLPKLAIARAAEVPVVASNAPLKYSRHARNEGCNNPGDFPPEEAALFECPVADADPVYYRRFRNTMLRVSRKNQAMGLKPLKEEQIEKMFRAHRVWDATMADSIVTASSGTSRVIHLVGSFHVDYDGGLIEEIRARAPELSIVTISIKPVTDELRASDAKRADIVVYSGVQQQEPEGNE